ncbi:mitochondrial carrier [Marasmius fiardii PR-910]|nr:mitochondrial carrier [Marasmius fiardii PR-910]
MAGDDHIRIVGAIAGIGSGLTKVTVGHGFDTIKTRLQCSPPNTYKGAFDALFKIVKNEGPRALYKGATPPAVGWAAIDSLLLGSLHNYRLFLIRHGMTEQTHSGVPRLTILGHGIAGLCAGVTSTIIATPVENIKVKLQLQIQRSISDRQFRGPVDCIRQIWNVQGPLGLWSGFQGSIAFRSNFFWMFLSFEALMRGFSQLKGTPFEMSTGTANFLAGGLGSYAFWLMAIPADNVKNRMMAHPYPQRYALPPSGRLKVPSFLSVARVIIAQDGVRGFFRGLGPCFLRAFPVNASAMFVYEGLLRVLGAEKTRH